MREKICLREVVVVEGRYDASSLAGIVDALILTTNGFSIFTDEEKKGLLRKLAQERGVLILTDSDAAGFRIRHYVEKIVSGCVIRHAYIPSVQGKESRKRETSKEGLLGVEGMKPAQLREALQKAGVHEQERKSPETSISYHDLYELGISGGEGSAEKRRKLLQSAKLPLRLSKKALREVLSTLYTKEALQDMLKPVLFWDFHGTLTLPDIIWFDVVKELAAEISPQTHLSEEALTEHLGGKCLPWFSVPSRDTRHLKGSTAWWGHCETEFALMLKKCGFSQADAQKIAPRVRERVLQSSRYRLYPDALSTLKSLQERGYRHYMLSNNFPELATLSEALGLSPYFSGVIVSGAVGYAKPRKELFETAREMAAYPAECYIIGDNIYDDIEGGKAAGFHTVLVHTKASQEGIEEYRLQNLADLLPLFP